MRSASSSKRWTNSRSNPEWPPCSTALPKRRGEMVTNVVYFDGLTEIRRSKTQVPNARGYRIVVPVSANPGDEFSSSLNGAMNALFRDMKAEAERMALHLRDTAH